MDNTFIDSIKKYFRGVRAEWGKITWPEKNQVVMETIFVIAIVTAFTIAIYAIDIIFKYGLDFIRTLINKM